MSRFYDFATDVFGFAAYNSPDNEVVVSFRGTNGMDVKNWLTNLNSQLVQYENVTGALVHVGWYRAYLTFRE